MSPAPARPAPAPLWLLHLRLSFILSGLPLLIPSFSLVCLFCYLRFLFPNSTMAAAGVTHPSSPRLPSPPPFTEVQIGPKSPSVGESIGRDAEQYLSASQGADDGSTRRIRPGTKAADMAVGPPLIPLSQVSCQQRKTNNSRVRMRIFSR